MGNPELRWGEWSEWVWEPDQRFWYRIRQDAQGNQDYDYGKVPRSKGGDVDAITDGMRNLDPGSDADESDEYTYENYKDSSSKGKNKDSSSKGRDKESSSKGKDKESSSKGKNKDSSSKGKSKDSSSKGKDKDSTSRHHKGSEPDNKADTKVSGQSQVAQTTFPSSADFNHYDQYDQYNQYGTNPQGSYSTEDTYEPLPYTSAGPSSRPAYAPAPASYVPATTSYSQAAYETPYAYADASAAYAYDDGCATPKARYQPYRREADDEVGTMALDLNLDSRYQVHRSHRFQPGQVFKASFADEKGSANNAGFTGLTGKQEYQDTRGVTYVTGFRRFIVIANDEGHCSCVPILSYGGKACTKKGIKPRHHGIIHQEGQRPKLQGGEPKLGFDPVEMRITSEGEKISKESRVNYSKIVSIEHNQKVMFIGSISSSYWPTVKYAVNKCWNEKEHRLKEERERHHR